MAEESGVLDILEETGLDGRLREMRQRNGLHGGGEVKMMRYGWRGRSVCARVTWFV